ncbi:hypothetical protein TSOC_005272 [Tetrabaena socialis]|uniref:Uncharacterized protein n=1 Tax=Tetrabaena socialis TaxID=47790 RepID=A0A2J8A6S1_9CHLO|nr:hypothetical protein TSOC_005272 [Tetrabaena socialis]|eukprot:PNH08183.1 hypothetical protein TSOC_005272 [Tetrabaena socialis]
MSLSPIPPPAPPACYPCRTAVLALLRHGEALPAFWGFILFDVLVLRPPALELPYGMGTTAPPQQDGDVGQQLQPPMEGQDQQTGPRQRGKGPEVGQVETPGGGAGGGGAADCSVGEGGAEGPRRAIQVTVIAGTSGRGAARGAASGRHTPRRMDGRAAIGSSNSGSGGDALLAAAAAAASAVLPSSGLGRLRLAAAASLGPLLDFVVCYNACEAINAYLMPRRAEDVLAAPLVVQAFLSTCFATALYFHLRYFFHSMEMLWAAGFALVLGRRVARWQPLFDSPERSTSPVDFWNNRYVPGQRAAEVAVPGPSRALAAALPAQLRSVAFMGLLMPLTAVLFFRPWFRASYHRELRVLLRGPTGWAVRTWVLGIPPDAGGRG